MSRECFPSQLVAAVDATGAHLMRKWRLVFESVSLTCAVRRLWLNIYGFFWLHLNTQFHTSFSLLVSYRYRFFWFIVREICASDWTFSTVCCGSASIFWFLWSKLSLNKLESFSDDSCIESATRVWTHSHNNREERLDRLVHLVATTLSPGGGSTRWHAGTFSSTGNLELHHHLFVLR